MAADDVHGCGGSALHDVGRNQAAAALPSKSFEQRRRSGDVAAGSTAALAGERRVDAIAIVALNGLALGLASTLHCAGMCGAISCSLLMAHDEGLQHSAYGAVALTHGGRIMAYAAAGALAGGVGAPAIA